MLRIPTSKPIPAPVLQRKCACGGTPGPTGECEACRKKRLGTLQRSAAGRAPANVAPPLVHDVLRSPGQPLDPATRSFMEPRFGHDFGQVRVHTDSQAARSTQSVNALAYTVGRHIAFDAGQYRPDTASGRQLMAHELAHVVQQSAHAPATGLELRIAGNDSAEHQAERMGAAIESGLQERPGESRSGPVLQRQPNDAKDKPNSPGWTLPPYQPKPIVAPRSTGLQVGVTPCLSGAICQPPVKGSAWDFVQKTDEESTPRPKTPLVAKEVKRAAEALSPGVLKDIFEVTFNPGLSKNVAAQVDKCKEFNVSAPDASASCMEVPEPLEKQAARFNKGAECLQLDKAEDDSNMCFEVPDIWKSSFVETMVHEAAHIKFDRGTPVGISSRTSNKITLHELSEFYAQFSEFPVHYREVQANIANKSPQERQELLKSSNKAWVKLHVESEGEGFRGMLTKIRCINPCDKVTDLIVSMVEAVTATWPAEMKDALLTELSATDSLNWPMPAPGLRPPPPVHPKMPPLYQPRASFVPELNKSLEDLP